MNPEVKKLKQRTAEARKKHPEWFPPKEKMIRRKGMKTKKRLEPGTRCVYCGTLLTKNNATIDHIIPLIQGGTHNRNNLAWCCMKCNRAKGGMSVEEWKCM